MFAISWSGCSRSGKGGGQLQSSWTKTKQNKSCNTCVASPSVSVSLSSFVVGLRLFYFSLWSDVFCNCFALTIASSMFAVQVHGHIDWNNACTILSETFGEANPILRRDSMIPIGSRKEAACRPPPRSVIKYKISMKNAICLPQAKIVTLSYSPRLLPRPTLPWLLSPYHPCQITISSLALSFLTEVCLEYVTF